MAVTRKLTYSIVVIAYNQAEWIEESVLAVLAQECDPLEIILSDDCSTDGTFDKIVRLAADYSGPHTVILNRNPQNLGLIGHVNRTFDLASGEVIISVAGDDICFPSRAARTIDIFEAERPLLAFAQARVESFDGQQMPRRYQKASFYSSTDAKSSAVAMELYLGATCAWHKDLYRKYGPIEHAECYEDLILGFRAALEGRLALIDEDLVVYRVGFGLTNSRTTYTTREAFIAQRARAVTREIMVLRQRRNDAAVFGLAPSDTIMVTIEKRLRELEFRLDYLTEGFGASLRKGWKHPAAVIGGVLSERRRHGKAQRQG